MGLALSMTLTMILAAGIAHMISNEMIPEDMVGYGVIVILLSASAAGAVLAFKKIKHRRMVVCLLSGLAYYLSLLAVTALFFGGQYTGMGVTGLAVLGGCGSVGLLGLKREGKQKYARRKIKNC